MSRPGKPGSRNSGQTMPKTYFLAPTRDNKPSGPIALGNIIKSPRIPEAAINNPDSAMLRQLVSSAQVVVEQGATRDVTTSGGFGGSVWASFLEFAGLGAGIEIGARLENAKAAAYRFDSLTSITINPDMAAVRDLFSESEVQAALRSSRFNANLYMITGVQVARGTRYLISGAKRRGQFLHLSTDLTPAGAPVTVGTRGGTTLRLVRTSTGLIEEDFVFAYRLREIVYRRRVVQKQREYHKGDLYTKGGKRGEQSRADDGEGPLEYTAEVLDLKPEDPDLPDLWEMDTITAEDSDGQEVKCVLVGGGDDSDADDH